MFETKIAPSAPQSCQIACLYPGDSVESVGVCHARPQGPGWARTGPVWNCDLHVPATCGKVNEVSRNQLDAISEYDQHALQGNSIYFLVHRVAIFATSCTSGRRRSEVFKDNRLQLICAQGSGKPELELCRQCQIILYEILDLLDRCHVACNVAFQDYSPISSSFLKMNLNIIKAMKQVAHHTARAR